MDLDVWKKTLLGISYYTQYSINMYIPLFSNYYEETDFTPTVTSWYDRGLKGDPSRLRDIDVTLIWKKERVRTKEVSEYPQLISYEGLLCLWVEFKIKVF